jgi:hypothetical protein
MQPGNDQPIESWSDDELRQQYRQLTGDLSDATDQERPDVSQITDEMRRRGLAFSDAQETGFPDSESMELGGDIETQDPGSGAPPV